MGCDIHLHVEVKIKGKWEHYNHPHINRNYDLFSMMAGVRQYATTPTPISQPRGLPGDVSTTTLFDCVYDGSDGHSHSWLSSLQAGAVQNWYKREVDSDAPPLFGYLFGNYIDSYIENPKDGERLFQMGFSDARVVFWFDN